MDAAFGSSSLGNSSGPKKVGTPLLPRQSPFSSAPLSSAWVPPLGKKIGRLSGVSPLSWSLGSNYTVCTRETAFIHYVSHQLPSWWNLAFLPGMRFSDKAEEQAGPVPKVVHFLCSFLLLLSHSQTAQAPRVQMIRCIRN